MLWHQRFIVKPIIWLCLLWAFIVISCWGSWQLHRPFHFIYPLWYKILNIEQTIRDNVPINRHNKTDFPVDQVEEHYRLFAAISRALHRNDNELSRIRYRSTINNAWRPLLTPAEIIHLQDVAVLITSFNWMAIISVIIASVCIFIVRTQYPPPWHFYTIACTATVGCIALPIMLLGAQNVFYWLHKAIFPPNHQWFFYYNDSLMSTLMQAPNLFGGIAMTLAAGATLIFIVLLVGTHRYIRARSLNV